VTAVRAVAWRFLALVATRRLAAWVGERGRKFEDADDPDMLMVGLSMGSMLVLVVGVGVFGWWVITGRGPGRHLAGTRWFSAG
jgi:hypothetical protein